MKPALGLFRVRGGGGGVWAKAVLRMPDEK